MNFLRTNKNTLSSLFFVVMFMFLLFPILNSHHHESCEISHHCIDEPLQENSQIDKKTNTSSEFKEICFKCELSKLFFNQQIAKDVIFSYSLFLQFFFKEVFSLILPFVYCSIILLKLGRAPPKLIHL